MKKNLLISLKLTLVMIVICAGLYPLLIAAIGKTTPGGGKGKTLSVNGKVVGYELVGQKFTDDKYFWSRPSAVDYNAAGSGGSNKGPTNPDYLKTVQNRIDSFLVHNPGIQKQEIPSDLVTASGAGLDPHISVQGAYVQISRVARVRNLAIGRIKALVEQHVEKPLLGLFGTEKVNVLQLNIDLDNVK